VSIIMAAITDAEALIGVDTDAVNTVNAQRQSLSKATVIPHLRAIIAARGPVSCAWYVTAASASAGMEFDAIIDRLADLTCSSWHSAAMVAAQNHQPEPEATQIVVAGWSESLKAITGARCDRNERGEWIVTSLRGQAYVSPYEHEIVGMQLPVSVAQMADAAPLIVGMLKQHYPNKAGGGRLLVGRATKDRAGFLDLGEIEPRTALGAPSFRVAMAGGMGV
jgi:hypothetical protein